MELNLALLIFLATSIAAIDLTKMDKEELRNHEYTWDKNKPHDGKFLMELSGGPLSPASKYELMLLPHPGLNPATSKKVENEMVVNPRVKRDLERLSDGQRNNLSELRWDEQQSDEHHLNDQLNAMRGYIYYRQSPKPYYSKSKEESEKEDLARFYDRNFDAVDYMADKVGFNGPNHRVRYFTTNSEMTPSDMAKKIDNFIVKKYFDKLHEDYLEFEKKNFDPIDRSAFNTFAKRNFDPIDRSSFNSFIKKNFDPMNREAFTTFIKMNLSPGFKEEELIPQVKEHFGPVERAAISFLKRNFDPIDRSAFNTFSKKNMVPTQIDKPVKAPLPSLNSLLFESYVKKNFDPIDRSGFDTLVKKATQGNAKSKKNFDPIDRSGFDTFIKRSKRTETDERSENDIETKK